MPFQGTRARCAHSQLPCLRGGLFCADAACMRKRLWQTCIARGTQGIDFGSNIAIPTVDFGTLHLYPGNWLLKPTEYHWLIPNYMADRAGIALKAGKPIILEVRTASDSSSCLGHCYTLLADVSHEVGKGPAVVSSDLVSGRM